MDYQDIVKKYQMQSHPEGGYFVETYRSDLLLKKSLIPKAYSGDRNSSTAILYLLPKNTFSRFHRLKSDEIFHFYLGGCLEVFELTPDGQLIQTFMSHQLDQDHQVQHVIKAGNWFGCCPSVEADFCFIGCTVAPGFDFEDFEIAKKDQLLKEYPQHEKIIHRLTK